MEKFKRMCIPCTKEQYPEVKSLLERMGYNEYSASGVDYCVEVLTYEDGDFLAINHCEDTASFTNVNIKELRAMSRNFEAMWIPCNQYQYPEVKQILEELGYSVTGIDFMCNTEYYTGVDTDVKGSFIALSKNVVEAPTVTVEELRKKVQPSVTDDQALDRLQSLEDRMKRIEVQLGLVESKVTEKKVLKDWAVSLTHDTLSQEEVATRCFAAAHNRGYERYLSLKCFTSLADHALTFGHGNAQFFSTSLPLSKTYGIVHATPHEETTLELFEEYCGIRYFKLD